MPVWDGPATILPAFSGQTEDGRNFRWDNWRQKHHVVIGFAGEGDNSLLARLASRLPEIRANGGEIAFVAPPEADLPFEADIPVIRDPDGQITSRFEDLLEWWRPPVIFVADRYGEIVATTDICDPLAEDNIVEWVFSTEVQCAL